MSETLADDSDFNAEAGRRFSASWLKGFRDSAGELMVFGSSALKRPFESILWHYGRFLNEAIRESKGIIAGDRKFTTICGQPFSILRQDDENWPAPAYSIIPSGNFEPINLSCFASSHRIYSEAFYKMIKLTDNNIDRSAPSAYSIETPKDWFVGNIPVEPPSWVNDFGVAVFRFPLGLRGLTGRFEGHPVHEAVHRAMAVSFKELYLNFFMHHPYLNESVSDAIALLDYQPETNFDGGNPANKYNPIMRELATGNHLNYYTSLTAEDLLHPLGFRDLDGEGKYNLELYIPRFSLAAFVAVLSSSYQSYKGESLIDESSFLQKLDFGLSKLSGHSRIQNSLEHPGIKNLIGVFHRLNRRLKSGEKISGDNFWQELTGNSKITEEKMEEYYKRSAALILPLFIAYKDVYGGMGLTEWWESIPRQIQNVFNKHAPKIPHFVKNRELFLPFYSKIVESLPPLI